MDQVIRKARIIELHPINMNREAGFDLSRLGEPLIHILKK
jgi:hypothetical protein